MSEHLPIVLPSELNNSFPLIHSLLSLRLPLLNPLIHFRPTRRTPYVDRRNHPHPLETERKRRQLKKARVFGIWYAVLHELRRRVSRRS